MTNPASVFASSRSREGPAESLGSRRNGADAARDARMSEQVRLEGSEDALEDFLKIFAMDRVPAHAGG